MDCYMLYTLDHCMSTGKKINLTLDFKHKILLTMFLFWVFFASLPYSLKAQLPTVQCWFCYLLLLVMAEWTGYQGRKVKEADEGKEKQGKEDPRCKEGNESTFEI